MDQHTKSPIVSELLNHQDHECTKVMSEQGATANPINAILSLST
jgi:hypothetical protein